MVGEWPGLDARDPDDILGWLPDFRVPASWAGEIEAGSTEVVGLEVRHTVAEEGREWIVALAINDDEVRTLVGWSKRAVEWQIISQLSIEPGDMDAEEYARDLLVEENEVFREWLVDEYPATEWEFQF